MLRKLGTASAGEAWKAFLQKYSSLIIKIARQYQHDEQGLHDCYLFVCEKLVDDGFRRLRTWKRKENVRFASWLRAVVANLCIDWYRSEFGRHRPFSSLSDLSELERLVYTHRFEIGASFRESYEAVAITYPDLTELEFAAIIRRVNSVLTPQQHWVIAARRRVSLSFDDVEVRQETSLTQESFGSPEDLATGDQEKVRIDMALQQLTIQQRVLIKLRYQQELPLKEVARLVGLDDPSKARYQIRLALERLSHLLTD